MVDVSLELEAETWCAGLCPLLEVAGHMLEQAVTHTVCSFLGTSALLQGFFLCSSCCSCQCPFFFFSLDVV